MQEITEQDIQQAIAIVREDRRASITYLQRKMKTGYNRSARLIEELEKRGVISAIQPEGGREVLGLAPVMSRADIVHLLNNVEYRTLRVPGTTTTLAVAVLFGEFTVATGESSCLDPNEFNEKKGEDLAIQDANSKAEKELYHLEAYARMRDLHRKDWGL